MADSYSDMEKGTGAVKITPAHDFNDFEVGRRRDLELLNIFDEHAALNENVPEGYQWLDRFEARKKLVEELDSIGALGEIEDNQHAVPHGDRSGVPVEPWLMDQWYVNAEALAKPAIEAVRDGRTKFVPQRWEKTYFDWMENISPGAYHASCGEGIVYRPGTGLTAHPLLKKQKPEAKAAAAAHYGHDVDLVQDDDVLDTWFSSRCGRFLPWAGQKTHPN